MCRTEWSVSGLWHDDMKYYRIFKAPKKKLNFARLRKTSYANKQNIAVYKCNMCVNKKFDYIA